MDRFKEPTDPVTVRHCSHCGGEIYAGDYVTEIYLTGAVIHENCEAQYVDDNFIERRGTIAADGGID